MIPNNNSLNSIFSGENKHRHGTLIFIVVACLILTIAVISYKSYFDNNLSEQTPTILISEDSKEVLLEANSVNPPAILTTEQIKVKEALLKSKNPSAKLTQEEIKAKAAQVGTYIQQKL